jgi:hypothetical protein
MRQWHNKAMHAELRWCVFHTLQHHSPQPGDCRRYLLQQWNMRRRLITILAAAFAMIAIGVVTLLRSVDETYRNYSALRVTETFLKSHLTGSPEPAFPESWATIKDEYEAFCVKNQTGFPLTEIQQRVAINWAAGRKYFQQPTAKDNQSAIITLTDGSTMQWHGDDPNANVVLFIQELQRSTTRK